MSEVSKEEIAQIKRGRGYPKGKKRTKTLLGVKRGKYKPRKTPRTSRGEFIFAKCMKEEKHIITEAAQKNDTSAARYVFISAIRAARAGVIYSKEELSYKNMNVLLRGEKVAKAPRP